MAFSYHVKTCGYLPNSKKTFDCYCKAISYLKEVLSKAPKDLDKEDLEMSITLLRVDPNLDDRVSALFPEKLLQGEPYLQKMVK